MFIIDNENSMKKIKCQFCYSSTMEEVMSFHVMAEPELHPSCGEWVMHMFHNLSKELQEEITFWGENFGHWYYVLDLLGYILSEDANYQCDLEYVKKKLLEMPLTEFLYYALGFSVPDLKIRYEDFTEWYADENKCKERLQAYHYDLIDVEHVLYFISHTEDMQKRLIQVIEDYWKEAFSREWESISQYVKDIIGYEELSLNHTTLLEYLSSFHPQLKLVGGYLTFQKKPVVSTLLSGIDQLMITPSIFGDGHLHGAVYNESRVNITMNLNYKAIQISRPIPESYFQLLKVLADESRFKILKVLWQDDATTKEISDILRLSPSTVSLHLKMLKEADLVTSSKIKKFVYYRLKKDKLMNLQDQMLDYLRY